MVRRFAPLLLLMSVQVSTPACGRRSAPPAAARPAPESAVRAQPAAAAVTPSRPRTLPALTPDPSLPPDPRASRNLASSQRARNVAPDPTAQFETTHPTRTRDGRVPMWRERAKNY